MTSPSMRDYKGQLNNGLTKALMPTRINLENSIDYDTQASRALL